MYRTLCVLALLTLQAGLAHCFSWDIVMAEKNRLEFYNDGKITYSVTFTDVDVKWITYDPFHNRLLLTNGYKSLLSFDIATDKIQNLIDLKPVPDLNLYTYDPATGLFFTTSSCKLYSYLVKPGSNNEVEANFVIDMGKLCGGLAVDSCTGDIYWISNNHRRIERARLDGSGREEVRNISDDNYRIFSLSIDSQTQNMYWSEHHFLSNQFLIYNADLNGKHIRTIMHRQGFHIMMFTFSNDFIYWTESLTPLQNIKFFWKFSKTLPIGTDVKPKQIAFNGASRDLGWIFYITANYTIEEQPQGIPLCKALKRLLPDYSETNDSNSLNVSTGGSLLHVNETKVSDESLVSGDTCDVSVCHNYCLHGNCSVSADGHPKCRCNAGYSGERCETNGCQAYCLHGGVCSLSLQNNPVCQCTGDYQGERCDVPAFLMKCSLQTVSLLKDAGLTSVTEGTGVKSTCAATVV